MKLVSATNHCSLKSYQKIFVAFSLFNDNISFNRYLNNSVLLSPFLGILSNLLVLLSWEPLFFLFLYRVCFGYMISDYLVYKFQTQYQFVYNYTTLIYLSIKIILTVHFKCLIIVQFGHIDNNRTFQTCCIYIWWIRETFMTG